MNTDHSTKNIGDRLSIAQPTTKRAASHQSTVTGKLDPMAKKKNARMLTRRGPNSLAERREEAFELTQRVENTDLRLLLRVHALQSSEIVDRAAQTEASLLSFVALGKSREVTLLTPMIRQLDAVRSGALRDLERVARTVEELENPTPRVTVYATVPAEQKARVLDLQPRRKLERK